jgi:hypothetical protein
LQNEGFPIQWRMSELRSQRSYETNSPTWGLALALVCSFVGPSGQQCHVVSTHGGRPLVG